MSTEQIKDLLKEIMKTKDPDLIKMATDMLKSENTDTQEATRDNSSEKEFEFTMKPTSSSSVGGTPVNKTPRANSFVDDGTESLDIKTPSFTPTERKRAAYKPIQQTCTRCSKSEMVNRTHARENYICNKCLGR